MSARGAFTTIVVIKTLLSEGSSDPVQLHRHPRSFRGSSCSKLLNMEVLASQAWGSLPFPVCSHEAVLFMPEALVQPLCLGRPRQVL